MITSPGFPDHSGAVGSFMCKRGKYDRKKMDEAVGNGRKGAADEAVTVKEPQTLIEKDIFF